MAKPRATNGRRATGSPAPPRPPRPEPGRDCAPARGGRSHGEGRDTGHAPACNRRRDTARPAFRPSPSRRPRPTTGNGTGHVSHATRRSKKRRSAPSGTEAATAATWTTPTGREAPRSHPRWRPRGRRPARRTGYAGARQQRGFHEHRVEVSGRQSHLRHVTAPSRTAGPCRPDRRGTAGRRARASCSRPVRCRRATSR